MPLLLVSAAVLAIAALALGAPSVMARVPRDGRTPALGTAAAAALFLLVALGARRLDPYALAIFAATTWAALAAAAERHGRPFGAADLALWLLLWIPFDLRWHYHLFPADEHAYDWWALYLVVLGAVAFGRLRALEGFDYRLAPRPRDVALGALGLAGVLLACVPLGLALGFVRYPGVNEPSLAVATVAGPGIFLTIALPEELYFRAVLQAGLERSTGRPALSLAAASVAFGLMHWNNARSLEVRLEYVLLATLAGAVYGLVYRRAGILAAALTHAGVDLIWHLYLDAGLTM